MSDQAAPFPILQTSLEGRILWSSEGGEGIGASASIFDIVSPAEKEALQRSWVDVVHGGTHATILCSYIRNGKQVPGRLEILPVIGVRPPACLVLVLLDPTEESPVKRRASLGPDSEGFEEVTLATIVSRLRGFLEFGALQSNRRIEISEPFDPEKMVRVDQEALRKWAKESPIALARIGALEEPLQFSLIDDPSTGAIYAHLICGVSEERFVIVEPTSESVSSSGAEEVHSERFDLPRSAPEVAPEVEDQIIPLKEVVAENVTARQSSKKRALIADENKISQRMLKRVLEEEGFEVSGVATGAEALESIQHEFFDLIILECRLSGESGYKVCEQARSLEKKLGRRSRILGISNNIEADSESRAKGAGMDGFLPKPIHVESLRTLITK